MTRSLPLRLFNFLFLSCCVFLFGVSGHASAYSSQGKILFSSDRDGDKELFTTNLDGTELTQLTFNNSNETGANWSPDGTKIAYVSDADGDKEIFVANSDLSNPVQLTFNSAEEGWIDWSPDGTQIAFASNRTGNYDVWSMNADGTNQIQLTSSPNLERSPGWSPDGTKFLYTAKYGQYFQIYMANLDGTNRVNLSNNTHNDQAAAWSGEANAIVFRSDRDGDLEIFTMNPNGSNQTKLTSNTVDDQGPIWSSDGSAIGFRSLRDGNPELYLMNPDGSNQTRVTTHEALDFDLSIFNGNVTTPISSPTPLATLAPSPIPTNNPTLTTTITQVPSNFDVNQDGVVDLGDIRSFVTNQLAQLLQFDVRGNGNVDIFDFNALISHILNPELTPISSPTPTLADPTPTSAPSDKSSEVKLFDAVVQFVKSDNGFHILKEGNANLPSGVPTNWKTPINYYDGQWQYRVQIVDHPTGKTGKLNLCFWKMPGFNPENCAINISHSGLGAFTGSSTPSIDGSANGGWARIVGGALDFLNPKSYRYSIILRGPNNCVVTSKAAVTKKCPELWDDYKDMRFKLTIVMVKAGKSFSGWENY